MIPAGGLPPDAPDTTALVMPAASAERTERAKASLTSAKAAVVHCDGGCNPNPGAGGWGVTIDADDQPTIPLWGGVADTTNNRMEMTAAIIALAVLPPGCAVTVFSDSRYLVDGMTLWLPRWRRKGFRRGQKDMPSADLWRTLNTLSAGLEARWEWIRSHSGHAGNKLVDALATRGKLEAQDTA